METSQLAEVCFHTFNSSAGKLFLEYLIDMYLNQRVYQPGMSFDHVAYLEGKRHVVDEILGFQRMYLTGEHPAGTYVGEEEDGGSSGQP